MNKNILSRADTGFIRSQFEIHLRKKGIDIKDECNARIYAAAIQGATTVRFEAARIANETYNILIPTVSDHHNALYNEIEKFGQTNTREILIRQFCEPITVSYLKYMMENYRNSNNILQILRFLKGINSTGLQIVYQDDSLDSMKISDPLGLLSYNLESREIELSIFVDKLIDQHALEIVSGEDVIDIESLFVMVLAHELSHLGSAEVASKERAIVRKRILELRGINTETICDIESMNDLLEYRSGYTLFTIVDDGICICDTYNINEAITELVARDFYDTIISSGEFPNLKKEYSIMYIKEVRAFEEALHEFVQEHSLNYEETLSHIKQGYFHGGKDMIQVFDNILSPIYQRYRDLIDLYNIKKESNIILP